MDDAKAVNRKIYLALIVFIISICALPVNAKAQHIDKQSFYSYLKAFPLKNQDDLSLDYLKFNDHLVIVNFIFTHCPAVCPTQNIKLAELYLLLPEKVQNKVKFLSISIDPARDTPSVLKNYSQQLNINQFYWSFVTGPVAAIEQIKKELQLMDPNKKSATLDDHRTGIWLLDNSGIILQRYRGNPLDVDRIQSELIALHKLKFLNN